MKKIGRYFLDTANINQIQKGIKYGFISGVTTNPIILSKESNNYKRHVEAILKILPENWEISLAVRADTAEEMIRQAKILCKWDKRIRVKIPANQEGLKAASELKEQIPLNMTIVKSASQALLCQALTINNKSDIAISLFCGRMNHAGYDWKETLCKISNVDWSGNIIAASIKTPLDVSDAVYCGADIITAPIDVYEMILDSKLTLEDIEMFNEPFNSDNFRII